MAQAHLEQGEVIPVGDYTVRILRKVAEGGMGAVYEGEQLGVLGFRKTVALKTIRTEMARDPEFIQMFIGEAKLVANLIHANIVQLYHLGAMRRMYYMAMEFVDGVTLYDLMNRHRQQGLTIPYEISAFIASRVCRALTYAHNATDANGQLLGVVHRDCTPKNIMIDRRGVVKLTDFGVAKALHYFHDKEGEVLVGKLAYLSPEQAAYRPTDGRSDLFTLGIVLWECLTNCNLFEESDTMRSLQAVQSRPIVRPGKLTEHLPARLERIVLQALERDRGKRYQSAEQMCQALEGDYLYHDRFGVTDDTLRNYLMRIYPELYADKAGI